MSAPYLLIADIAYTEQDGLNRQTGGSIFDNVQRYSLIIPMKTYFICYMPIFSDMRFFIIR
ncbi:hypothetical protein FACS189499_08310 [Clostridia bacterium]|nr:hypothetical protein FACS189499_08310 [Clostridia bacterium]